MSLIWVEPKRHACGRGALLLLCLGLQPTSGADVRAQTRLFRPADTAVTETQASELTLTLTEAATRPIQTWIRTAGMLGKSGKTVTALLRAPEAELVQVGQRLRTFSIDSRTQMHQARISRINRTSAGTSIEATLSDRAHDNGSRYLMEIVVERGRFLSVPNVSIVEEGTGPVVYVQQSPGRYAPRTIHIGLQGELYTEVLDGLEEGDQVVSIGSFFVDADSKLNSTNAQ